MTPYDTLEAICRAEAELQANYRLAADALGRLEPSDPIWTLEHLDEDGWPGDVVAQLSGGAAIRFRLGQASQHMAQFLVVSVTLQSQSDERDGDGYCQAESEALEAVTIMPVLQRYLAARFVYMQSDAPKEA